MEKRDEREMRISRPTCSSTEVEGLQATLYTLSTKHACKTWYLRRMILEALNFTSSPLMFTVLISKTWSATILIHLG